MEFSSVSQRRREGRGPGNFPDGVTLGHERTAWYSCGSRKRGNMRLLLNWVLSGLAVWLVAQVVPGFYVSGAFSALIAALVIGFINATIGLLLKIVTFPLTLLTLGLF